MRPVQIESWALDIINRVEAGQPNEDARVELKADGIDPQKAARQIAGHANSARGDPVLWLIGVDQDRGVTGVNHKELASWHAEVASKFDRVAPIMVDINVPYKDKTVVALLFETDRAPFVISNPAYGVKRGVSIAFEVPWREGTRTRTANRSDLIRLLVPILNLPEVETLDGELTLRKHDKYHWYLKIQLYVTPQIGAPVVIPFHRCEAIIKLPALAAAVDLSNIRLTPPYTPTPGPIGSGWEPDSHTVAHTQNELILQGPGVVNLSAEAWADKPPTELEGSTAEMRAKLSPTHANRSVVIAGSMVWDPSDDEKEIARWTL